MGKLINKPIEIFICHYPFSQLRLPLCFRSLGINKSRGALYHQNASFTHLAKSPILLVIHSHLNLDTILSIIPTITMTTAPSVGNVIRNYSITPKIANSLVFIYWQYFWRSNFSKDALFKYFLICNTVTP